MTDVLQVITSSVRRGAERFALALGEELTARGLDVETVALVPGGGDRGLPVEALGTGRLAPATLLELRRRMGPVGVTAAHGSTTLPACAVAGLGPGRPFVYRSIGDPRFWAGSGRRRLQSAVLLRRADRIVALTETTRRALIDLHRLDPDHIVPIPNGRSEDRFPRWTPQRRAAGRRRFELPADGPVVACIGSLTPEKDVLNAVRAMRGVPDDWHLAIAGDGPDRGAAERGAAEVAPGRVHLLGAIDEPAELLAAADVLVVPSRTEGLPGVAIEASLVGIPTVSTDVGAVREIVDDGVSGRVVPPGDPDALAAALVTVMERAAAMGEAARRRAQDRFTMSTVADRWYELLRGVLDARTAVRSSRRR